MQKVRSSATYEWTHCTFGASSAKALLDLAAAPLSSSLLRLPTLGISRSITNFRIIASRWPIALTGERMLGRSHPRHNRSVKLIQRQAPVGSAHVVTKLNRKFHR